MILRLALLTFAFAASNLAWGQALDVPARIARLSYVEGEAAFRGAGGAAFTSTALPDRPLLPDDRLTTGRGGKAELTFGTATVRLDQGSELVLTDLDAATVRFELTAGTASVHLRELLEDETFEVVTPNTRIAFQAPGEYRVDVPSDSTTAFTVRAGAAEVATAGGPVRVADGQRVRLEGRDALAQLETPRPADPFDDWVLEREVQLGQAEPPPGEPYEGYEDEALDHYGEWYDEPDYGRVWMPAYAYGGYDPFGYGYWQRVSFGWTWIEPLPWGVYTSNYGRWAYLDHLNRWCWVPLRRDHRRHVAQDTRPFGRPRRDSPSRDERDDDAPPAVAWRRGDDDWGRPAAKSVVTSSPATAGRPTAPPQEAADSDRPRSGTFVPSDSPAKTSKSTSKRRPASPSTMTPKATSEWGDRSLP